ncbi:hypothetical protein VXJ25_08960 [Olsenella sp. YH-ols2223]|uniref:Flavodoxin-like domain-containing protein n=1 Tax=Olsenella absiana TaxID=3115222 RepID=A0ABU7RBX4_9ACTN
MVYYFSATGNSKYVAEGIAGALGDEAQSIQGCDGRLPRADVLGLVTHSRLHDSAGCRRHFLDALCNVRIPGKSP